jgi:hypothetical protein
VGFRTGAAMTSMSNKSMTMAEFARLLEVYGSERTRWPAEVRAPAALLVGADAQARRLLAEAEALDRLLERAPLPGPAVEAALAERIVAAAQGSPRVVRLPGVQRAAEAAAPAPDRATAAPPTAIGMGRRRSRLLSQEVGAAGFLAASLMVGVVIGNSTLPPRFLPALADMAGLAPDRDDLVKIALAEEVMQ